MEALIHHFKLVTEGFRVPPGEAYAAIESPRGELGCFVLADGSAKPARVHMRDPSLREPAGAAATMARGLAASPTSIASRRDARPDPRRGRPVRRRSEGASARSRHASARLGRGRPTWTRTPPTIPDPASVDVPDALRARDRGPHGQVPRPPLGRAPGARRRAAACTAGARPRRSPGGRGDAGHARLPVERRDLLRHAAHPAGRQRATCTCARAWPATCATRVGVRGDRREAARRRASRTWSCASSSASAPATWRRWRRSTALRGPARHEEDAPELVARASRRAASPLPGRGLERRRSSGTAE